MQYSALILWKNNFRKFNNDTNVKKEIIMSNSQNNPFGDVAKMLEKFKVPGVDMTAFIESRKKDIQAVVESNRKAMEGMQAVAQKQAELLKSAMQEIQSANKNLAGDLMNPVKQTELAKKAYAKALADMKDLADMSRKAQAESLAVITKRASEHMEEIKKLMTPK
jgi:phasin family protein